MSKHTPTPWRIEKFSGEAYTEREGDVRLVGANNISPAILFGGFPTPELEANKEFVIKAVNSYEAMREALELALRAIDAAIEKCPNNNDNNFIGYALTRDKIFAALAKYRGEA